MKICIRKIVNNYFKKDNPLVNVLACITLVSNGKSGVYDFKQYCECTYYCPKQEEADGVPYCGIK